MNEVNFSKFPGQPNRDASVGNPGIIRVSGKAATGKLAEVSGATADLEDIRVMTASPAPGHPAFTDVEFKPAQSEA